MSENATSRQSPQLLIRFPGDMKDRLQAQARANGRTMNAEIVARLERTLSADAGERNADESSWRQKIENDILDLGVRFRAIEQQEISTKIENLESRIKSLAGKSK